MKYFLLLGALIFSINNCFAGELAPGHENCMKKVVSFDDEATCYSKAHMYQSKRLDELYKKTRSLCDRRETLEQSAECKNELKKLELAWLDFQKRTYVYMLNEGIFGPYKYKDKDIAESYNYNIGRARSYAESFAAHETKRQADRMDLFYKLWERWQ